MNWMDRPIGDDMEARLKTVMRIQEDEPLPITVRKKYWEVEGICRRLGGPVTDRELILIGVILNVEFEEDHFIFTLPEGLEIQDLTQPTATGQTPSTVDPSPPAVGPSPPPEP